MCDLATAGAFIVLPALPWCFSGACFSTGVSVCLSISGCPRLWAYMLVVNIPANSEAQSKNFFTITFKSKVLADFGL